MKRVAVVAANTVLSGFLMLELWYVSGRRFGLFCVLLVLVGQACVLASAYLGGYPRALLPSWRPPGWLASLTLPAAIAFGVIASLVVLQQFSSYGAAADPCREVCMP